MVLFDHVKRDLSCLDESTTLLSVPHNYLMIANVESNLQGAYLYYDMNDNKWIRSGKVTGRGFDVRHKEHQKKAKCHNHQSKFYSRYPSLESKLLKSCSRKGAFEGLVRFIACRFNPSDKKNCHPKAVAKQSLSNESCFGDCEFTKSNELHKIYDNKASSHGIGYVKQYDNIFRIGPSNTNSALL